MRHKENRLSTDTPHKSEHNRNVRLTYEFAELKPKLLANFPLNTQNRNDINIFNDGRGNICLE